MRKTILCLLCAAGPLSAGAQASDSDLEARLDSLEKQWEIELNTLVVTGTRTPKMLKNSPILTRVISENDIRKTDATNISDLLQTELPGISFSSPRMCSVQRWP